VVVWLTSTRSWNPTFRKAAKRGAPGNIPSVPLGQRLISSLRVKKRDLTGQPRTARLFLGLRLRLRCGRSLLLACGRDDAFDSHVRHQVPVVLHVVTDINA
jgi:hypothetical protein